MREKGVLMNVEQSETWEIKGTQWILIGRTVDEGKGNIRLKHPSISKNHGRIKAHNGFFLEDLDSKNGTYVNGVKLRRKEQKSIFDGDQIHFAKEEYRFRCDTGFLEMPKIYGMKCAYRHTENGKKICFFLGDTPIVEYQLKMININPQLCIPECFYVQSIQRDSLMFEVTEMESLASIIEKGNLNWEGFLKLLERMMIIIRIGEHHMLFKQQYAISEDTLFLMPLHYNIENEYFENIKIIYFPTLLNQSYDFKTNLISFVQRILSCIDCQKEAAAALLTLLEDCSHTTEELLRALILFKEEKNHLLESETQIQMKLNIKERFEVWSFDFLKFIGAWKISFISYAMFMAAFWMEILNTTELAGLGIVLIGLNAFLMSIKKDAQQEKEG